jgi:glutaredoxin
MIYLNPPLTLMGPPLKVTFYTKEKCSLCDLAHEMLNDLREDASFELETVDITKSPGATDAYREMIPVIQVGQEIIWGRIDENDLREFLLRKM